jgi:transposase, IS5 family
VNVDKTHKFIRKIVTDTASTHDSQHCEAVMDPANTNRDAYADRGYPSEEREAWLQANGYRNRIQRKGHRNKPLSEAQQGVNSLLVVRITERNS